MTATNGTGDLVTMTNGQPVVLVCYRPGITTNAGRTVHLIPMPVSGEESSATALCGAVLHPSDIEIVAVGQGMPCNLCLVRQITDSPPASTVKPTSTTIPADAGPDVATAGYQRWGWPVTVSCNQVRLTLAPDTVALIIPTLIATEVTEILTARRCLPPVLDHPYVPEHRVLLAGEPYPVALTWPTEVHRVTSSLLLPPSVTPRGPLRWVRPPHENSLRLCREIDVLAAVRTADQQSEK